MRRTIICKKKGKTSNKWQNWKQQMKEVMVNITSQDISIDGG